MKGTVDSLKHYWFNDIYGGECRPHCAKCAFEKKEARIAELEKDKVELVELGTDQFVTEKILKLEARTKRLAACVNVLHKRACVCEEEKEYNRPCWICEDNAETIKEAKEICGG